MITFLGFGHRDRLLFELIRANIRLQFKYIDYRTHFPLSVRIGDFKSKNDLVLPLNSTRIAWKRTHNVLYSAYLRSFSTSLKGTRLVILPGRHRLWERAAYDYCILNKVNVLFYEAADRNHIYFAKNGVCGDAMLLPNNERFDGYLDIPNYLRSKGRKWFWAMGLVKLDSGEFWKAIRSRINIMKRDQYSTQDLRLITTSDSRRKLLFIGQVPWDLNAIVYGLANMSEVVERVDHIARSFNINLILYKPHPLYFDMDFVTRFAKTSDLEVVVVHGKLDEEIEGLDLCLSVNSNGLIEFKHSNINVNCIFLGQSLYSGLLAELNKTIPEEQIKVYENFFDKYFIKCDYRNGPLKIDKRVNSLISNIYHEDCSNWT